MKVILKQDIKGIGQKYQIKDVADGYANNFLIPKKMAEFATPKKIKEAESLKLINETQLKEKMEKIEKQIETLKKSKIILKKKANDKGHLFEQVRIEEIAGVLKEQIKIEIDPELLQIEKPIKEIGEHKFSIDTGKAKEEISVKIEAL